MRLAGSIQIRFQFSGGDRQIGKTEKVRHVLRARQTRKHTCHWPGCIVLVPPAIWGCKRHWFRLPKALRDKVWAAYVPLQEERMDPSDIYLKVVEEVEHWITKQGGA